VTTSALEALLFVQLLAIFNLAAQKAQLLSLELIISTSTEDGATKMCTY